MSYYLAKSYYTPLIYKPSMTEKSDTAVPVSSNGNIETEPMTAAWPYPASLSRAMHAAASSALISASSPPDVCGSKSSGYAGWPIIT